MVQSCVGDYPLSSFSVSTGPCKSISGRILQRYPLLLAVARSSTPATIRYLDDETLSFGPTRRATFTQSLHLTANSLKCNRLFSRHIPPVVAAEARLIYVRSLSLGYIRLVQATLMFALLCLSACSLIFEVDDQGVIDGGGVIDSGTETFATDSSSDAAVAPDATALDCTSPLVHVCGATSEECKVLAPVSGACSKVCELLGLTCAGAKLSDDNCTDGNDSNCDSVIGIRNCTCQQ